MEILPGGGSRALSPAGGGCIEAEDVLRVD